MARCRHGGHAQAADADGVAVPDGGAVEGDLVVGVDEVRGTRAQRQGETAGDVVVVEVRLQDVGQPDAVTLEDLEHPVDVALRVDDERDLAVVHDVRAVAERRSVDRDNSDPSWLRASPDEIKSAGVVHPKCSLYLGGYTMIRH